MIKIRNNLPTKKSITDLCEKHNVSINSLNSFENLKSFSWSDSRDNNTNAMKVFEEFKDAGLDVTFRAADKTKLLNGAIRFNLK